MPVRRLKKNGRERRYIALAWAVPIALIMLVPSLVGLYLTFHLIGENSRRIQETRHASELARANSRQAQLINCRGTNTISLSIRKVLLDSTRQSVPILVALGYTPEQIKIY